VISCVGSQQSVAFHSLSTNAAPQQTSLQLYVCQSTGHLLIFRFLIISSLHNLSVQLSDVTVDKTFHERLLQGDAIYKQRD